MWIEGLYLTYLIIANWGHDCSWSWVLPTSSSFLRVAGLLYRPSSLWNSFIPIPSRFSNSPGNVNGDTYISGDATETLQALGVWWVNTRDPLKLYIANSVHNLWDQHCTCSGSPHNENQSSIYKAKAHAEAWIEPYIYYPHSHVGLPHQELLPIIIPHNSHGRSLLDFLKCTYWRTIDLLSKSPLLQMVMTLILSMQISVQ